MLLYIDTTESFQHFTVRDLSWFTVNDDGLVPSPHVVDEFLVLLVGWVQLAVRVGFPVWSDIEGWGVVLASDHDGTGDTIVVVFTVDD